MLLLMCLVAPQMLLSAVRILMTLRPVRTFVSPGEKQHCAWRMNFGVGEQPEQKSSVSEQSERKH